METACSSSEAAGPRVVVLTGAGISAESGLATFRGDGGLWEGRRPEDVATPQAFARSPAMVHRFYNLRRAAVLAALPNPAHFALARLQQALGPRLTLVTQNIDDLHERAGATAIHMHGEVRKARCKACAAVLPWDGELAVADVCPACGRPRCLRPHVVWFGENPFHLDEIFAAVEACDVFAAVGTSGRVYPAAGLAAIARAARARCHEFNLEPGPPGGNFDTIHAGPAGTTLGPWVEKLVAAATGP
jgi:NAD-dependent deacetylase